MKKSKESVIKRIIKNSIIYLAKSILKKHKTQIIGIAGSVGKTSTKDAIVYLLKDEFNIRESYKNQNTEMDLAFTILGVTSIDKSLSGLLKIYIKYFKEFNSKKYPEILVLEYGINKETDMDSLIKIAKPSIAVITKASCAYDKFLDNVNNIALERFKLALAVNCDNKDKISGVILNGDDINLMKSKKDLICPTYIYSTKKKASYYSTGVHLNFHQNLLYGISFKINYDGNSVPIRLPNVIASHQIYSILASITVASIYKINMVNIAEKLQEYIPPVSRMRYINGINGSKIIDDTYEASPESTEVALRSLEEIKANTKILIIGDMLGLGEKSKESHKEITKKIVNQNIDFVILVGEKFSFYLDLFLENEFVLDENLFVCSSPMKAVDIIRDRIKENDLILVKGSQNMRMEKVVEKIVDKNIDVSNAICRQGKYWKDNEFVQ